MAVTVTIIKTPKGQIPTNGGFIPVSIVVTSGTAYATATGGVEIDFTTFLAELNLQNGGRTIADIQDVWAGVDNAGYVSGAFAKTTDNKGSLRHWINNGSITERADGSSWTSTMKALVQVAPA